MKKRIMNPFCIAVQNVRVQKSRSILMILFVIILSAAFFFSTFVTETMTARIEKTSRHLGADMIVTGEGVEDTLSRSLFSGQPCTTWFDNTEMTAIGMIQGVEAISPQLYIGSLEASCCTSASQLIAIDPESDFLVRSWLPDESAIDLRKGEVIIGAAIQSEPGTKIRFFNIEFDVKEKLEKTGTGYDNSVFMTYETAEMLQSSEQARDNMNVDRIRGSASMLMLRLTPGNDDPSLVGEILRTSLGKYSVFSADSLMSRMSDQVEQLSGYGRLLTVILVIATALALICIFVINMNERKEEFGILTAIGADRRILSRIVLSEAMLISVTGGLLGTFLSGALVAIFKDILTAGLGIPAFDPEIGQLLSIGLTGVFITVVTGLIAAVIVIIRFVKGEPYDLIREAR